MKKHDHIKSKDLYRWLKYVDMTEEEFDRVCTFRDPKVWWQDRINWIKDNIWDDVETQNKRMNNTKHRLRNNHKRYGSLDCFGRFKTQHY